MQQVRAVVEHALDVAEIAGALPFNHVAGQGIGAAGEADEGHGIVQGTADLTHRIHDVAQVVVGIRRSQVVDRPFLAQGTLETRTLAFGEVEAQAHGIGHRQDVREQDGGIQVVAGQGLQGHFAGQGRGFAQVQEVAGPLAGLAVFRQVTAGLAHQPEGGVIGRFLEQGAQEGVVAGSGSRWAPPINWLKDELSPFSRPPGTLPMT